MIGLVNSSVKKCHSKLYSFNKIVKRLKTSSKQSQWNSVVGLEVHAQIDSNSKLFSGAKCDFGGLVNNCVSYLDAAIPGTLPVINRKCVEAGVLTALALSCKINPVSMFDRKHYFYADLPAGYQITQQRAPLAQDGKLPFQVSFRVANKKSYMKESRIKQIQLEQDSGRSLHDEEFGQSLIDLNRAGCPLMELVFEPDLQDGEEAAALVSELILILEVLGSCSCKMEHGALRVDANVSVNLPGEPYGTRTEIKNIASVRGVANAITYEIGRQISIKENGGEIFNETRSYDSVHKVTVPMRDKESKQDYRYMPEPNLPPLHLNLSDVKNPDLVSVNSIQKRIPVLPEQIRQRLMSTYGFSREYATQLVGSRVLRNYFFDITNKPDRDPKIVGNLLMMELLTVVNKLDIELESCNLSSDVLGEIVDMKQAEEINLDNVRRLFTLLLNGETRSPRELVDINNWRLVKDKNEIESICLKVFKENPKMVGEYKAGKEKVFSAIVKRIKHENSNLDMTTTIKILKELLKK